MTWEIVVQNVGIVLQTDNGRVAREHFAEYVQRSKAHTGRAAGEGVCLYFNGDIVSEYVGSLYSDEVLS